MMMTSISRQGAYVFQAQLPTGGWLKGPESQIILKTLHFAQFLCCVNVNDIKSVLSWKIFDPTLTLLININQLIQTVQHINSITTFEEL